MRDKNKHFRNHGSVSAANKSLHTELCKKQAEINRLKAQLWEVKQNNKQLTSLNKTLCGRLHFMKKSVRIHL